MDSTKYMIIAKGKICTEQVKFCAYNPNTRKYDLTFNNGAYYSYAWNNVSFLRNPVVYNFDDVIIETPDGKRLTEVNQVYEFDDKGYKFWHFVSRGSYYDFPKSSLLIKSASKSGKSTDVFSYLRDVSALSDIPNDNGEILLKKYYDNIPYVSPNSALYKYLIPASNGGLRDNITPIFPFGCNGSQYEAVTNALNNQISVIQGPPGTGKTQTILNIIANLLLNNKSVIVVSNNNSATNNVLEKLSNAKYGMDFLVASLGSLDNKMAFVRSQSGRYPNLSSWETTLKRDTLSKLEQISSKLHSVYQLNSDLASLNARKQGISLEFKHFEEYFNTICPNGVTLKCRSRVSSSKLMKVLQEIQNYADEQREIPTWIKKRNSLFYGIGDKAFYNLDFAKMISTLQYLYYQKSMNETDNRIKDTEEELAKYPKDLEKQLEDKALTYLKAVLSKRYKWNMPREVFSDMDLFQKSKIFLREYPIVLSTTFSSRACVNSNTCEFDYVIMDEASQVDVATGALALSVAKNAVIVGDLKQLPNVLTEECKRRAADIRKNYQIREAYDYGENSFLSSVVAALPDVPSTLLREHYRCHPKIISFCNQKFYDGELVIMTKDDGNEDALKAIMTVEGNHTRGHYNQRQIDIIKEEILPTLDVPKEEIGIIAPYNEQVMHLRNEISDIDISTVHKFQGREKDVIILSTVDDKIGDFTDDPYLLNVAVSRAKKKLIVVVSGNEQSDKGNIVDLVSYIRYNNMEIVDSKVYSIFDYLYSQYREQRWNYLKNKRKVSQYDSENLTYNLLLDILGGYPEYGVQCFAPLSMVVKDLSGLSEEEVRYASNPATHLDFLIYNKVTKQPVAAVETDGYKYHKEGTDQHERDLKKDHILGVVGIPIVRLNTTGSNEREKVLRILR